MPEAIFQFTLYTAACEPNSLIAQENLESLCSAFKEGEFEIKISDVLKDAEGAYEEGVVVTPTLLATRGERRVLVVGNLSNLTKVRAALQIAEPA